MQQPRWLQPGHVVRLSAPRRRRSIIWEDRGARGWRVLPLMENTCEEGWIYLDGSVRQSSVVRTFLAPAAPPAHSSTKAPAVMRPSLEAPTDAAYMTVKHRISSADLFARWRCCIGQLL